MNFQNSAKLCREREAHHRLAAQEATLINVRNIALSAAAAWARQAEEAEEVEAGLTTDLTAADAAIALEFRREDEASEGSGHEE